MEQGSNFERLKQGQCFAVDILTHACAFDKRGSRESELHKENCVMCNNDSWIGLQIG